MSKDQEYSFALGPEEKHLYGKGKNLDVVIVVPSHAHLSSVVNRIKSFRSTPSKLFRPDRKMLVASSSDPLPLNKRSRSVPYQGEKNHRIILPKAQNFIPVPPNNVQSSQLDLGRHAKDEAFTGNESRAIIPSFEVTFFTSLFSILFIASVSCFYQIIISWNVRGSNNPSCLTSISHES